MGVKSEELRIKKKIRNDSPMFTLTCPCGQRIEASDLDVGRIVHCPGCGQRLAVTLSPATNPGPPPKRRSPPPDPLADERRLDPALDGPPERSGKAMASLFLGLFSFGCSFFTALPAIGLGLWALSDIAASRRRLHGSGIATLGIFLAGLGMVFSTTAAVVGVRWAITQGIDSAKRLSVESDLEDLSQAMDSYYQDHHCYPPAAIHDPAGKPLYSWRVLLLPYLGHQDLYARFHLDEPWDSPHNRALLPEMPDVFSHPDEDDDNTVTRYQVFVGGGALFDDNKPTRLVEGPSRASMQEGQALSTILIVEAARAVPWTKPEDIAYDPAGPLPGLADQFTVLFADSHIAHIKKGYDERLVRAAISRSGKEGLKVSDLTDDH